MADLPDTERKLILYISMSLDGFIATEDDDLSWLSVVEKEGEDYGYADFLETVDTYIVGRITYETVLSLTGGVFPQAETLDCYILTRQERESENGVSFYNGDVETLINNLKTGEGTGTANILSPTTDHEYERIPLKVTTLDLLRTRRIRWHQK